MFSEESYYHAFAEWIEIIKRERKHSPSFSMKDALTSIIGELEPGLFPSGYYEKISSILEIFPDALTRTFFIETVLNNDISDPDIIIHFSNYPDVKKILAGKDPNIKISDRIFDNNIWQNLREFWYEWDKNGSDLEDVNAMWLEFDTGRDFTVPPIPSVFFRVDSSGYADWIVNTALSKLKGYKIDDTVGKKLELCFLSLPDGAIVSQIGTMLARQSEGVRLYIKRIKKSDCIPYLHKIGYSGDIDEAGKLCNKLSEFAPIINLQIEVDENISPRIDFECKLDPQAPEWNIFFYWLKENNLCTERNAEMLKSWQKKYVNNNPTSGSMPVYMLKYVNHIKIVYEPGKDLIAKGYRGLTYA